MSSKDFESFEEAKKYAKLNPGSRLIREVKYVVYLQTNIEDDCIKTKSEKKSNDIFKIESYPMIRVFNRQWRGNIKDITAIRQYNQKSGRLLNSGLPITVEEIELFKKWTEKGKNENELQDFFQRKIDNIPLILEKNQERIVKGYKKYYWDNGGLCSKHGWLNCDICNIEGIDDNDKETSPNESNVEFEILDPEALSKSLHKLKKLIFQSLNLEEIISYGNDNLDRLEASVSQLSVSEDDRNLLFDLSKKFKGIHSFYDELEDIQYMQYKDEFEESIGKFYKILETLDELEISKIVQKEIRELIVKSESSISSIKARKDKAYYDGINSLNNNRPNCIKCGKLMQVRNGENTHFWGCTDFPTCRGIKWFNSKELKIIGKT